MLIIDRYWHLPKTADGICLQPPPGAIRRRRPQQRGGPCLTFLPSRSPSPALTNACRSHLLRLEKLRAARASPVDRSSPVFSDRASPVEPEQKGTVSAPTGKDCRLPPVPESNPGSGTATPRPARSGNAADERLQPVAGAKPQSVPRALQEEGACPKCPRKQAAWQWALRGGLCNKFGDPKADDVVRPESVLSASDPSRSRPGSKLSMVQKSASSGKGKSRSLHRKNRPSDKKDHIFVLPGKAAEKRRRFRKALRAEFEDKKKRWIPWTRRA